MKDLVLLTIIVEEALSPNIEKEIEDLGASGYTTWNVSGKGASGIRDNQWEGENTKIETIVSTQICQSILNFLQMKYFDKYPIITFYSHVKVVRTSRFY